MIQKLELIDPATGQWTKSPQISQSLRRAGRYPAAGERATILGPINCLCERT